MEVPLQVLRRVPSGLRDLGLQGFRASGLRIQGSGMQGGFRVMVPVNGASTKTTELHNQNRAVGLWGYDMYVLLHSETDADAIQLRTTSSERSFCPQQHVT